MPQQNRVTTHQSQGHSERRVGNRQLPCMTSEGMVLFDRRESAERRSVTRQAESARIFIMRSGVDRREATSRELPYLTEEGLVLVDRREQGERRSTPRQQAATNLAAQAATVTQAEVQTPTDAEQEFYSLLFAGTASRED